MTVNLLDYELIMFDLDGTLVDSVPDIHLAINNALSSINLTQISEQECRNFVGNGAATLVQRALARDLNPPDIHPMFELCYDAFFRFYGQVNGQQATLYEGVNEVLGKLKQAKVTTAVVTNKPYEFTQPLLAQLGIHVDLIVGGDTCSAKKPHPTQLEHAISEFGVTPANTLMVGDSSNDILAAKAAGVKCVAVTYGYNHGKPITDFEPDFIIDSFLEFQLENTPTSHKNYEKSV